MSYVPNPEYQDFVRGYGCAVDTSPHLGVHFGAIEFAHVVKSRGAGGHDEGGGVGLCSGHHAEQHTIGVKSFAAKYGLNLKALAAALWVAFEREQGRTI